MVPPRRKKWTEAEERTLIDKYGQMVSEGTLGRMKTREKKFRPIALYVNSVHHVRDPVAFPWQWTWKDVSTKVQNMRHQYLLVKQKIKRPDGVVCGMENSGGGGGVDEFDWMEGLTHWSNFLRYKEVFGDVSSATYGVNNGNDLVGVLNEDRENGGQFFVGGNEIELVDFGSMVNSGDGDFQGIDGMENGVMVLEEFDYEGEEADENCDGHNDQVRQDPNDASVNEKEMVDCSLSDSRRERLPASEGLEKRVFRFLSSQLGKLRDMELQMEQREIDREQERKRREIVQMEREKEWERQLEKIEREREERDKGREKLRRQRVQKREAMEMDSEEVRKRRREEESIQDREWEDMMNMRRSESRKRIDGMLDQHRAEMGQVQTRILHEQQNLTGQLFGIVAQWTGHPAGLSDHASGSSHYFSQMMQSLHHVNAMVHADARVDGDAQEDQFIVDG